GIGLRSACHFGHTRDDGFSGRVLQAHRITACSISAYVFSWLDLAVKSQEPRGAARTELIAAACDSCGPTGPEVAFSSRGAASWQSPPVSGSSARPIHKRPWHPAPLAAPFSQIFFWPEARSCVCVHVPVCVRVVFVAVLPL